MTALMTVHNSEGLAGRCDARCYNATTPDCHCICRGANHGVGIAQAILNTARHSQAWLDAANAALDAQHPLRAAVHQACLDDKQTRLWTPEDLIV